MRLVEYLSGLTLFGKDEKVDIVVDAGTSTTAWSGMSRVREVKSHIFPIR
jgi:hypothetical protein